VTEVDLAQLDVFYGELTTAAAYVYARLPRPSGGQDLKLTGIVRGPRCLHAATLPLTARLSDLGPGPTVLARALIPDPSSWSPDLPAIYDVNIQVLSDGQVIATERRELGFRALGVRRTGFVMEGKPWVLRGIHQSSTSAALPREWHDASAAYVASQPTSEALAEASQFGALAVVQIDAGQTDIEHCLREVSKEPSVALAVIQGASADCATFSNVAPNVLLAQAIDAGSEPVVMPWAKAAWVAARDPIWLGQLQQAFRLPIVAVRSLEYSQPLEIARAECDRLQRELVTIGQFAGYVV